MQMGSWVDTVRRSAIVGVFAAVWMFFIQASFIIDWLGWVWGVPASILLSPVVAIYPLFHYLVDGEFPTSVTAWVVYVVGVLCAIRFYIHWSIGKGEMEERRRIVEEHRMETRRKQGTRELTPEQIETKLRKYETLSKRPVIKVKPVRPSETRVTKKPPSKFEKPSDR